MVMIRLVPALLLASALLSGCVPVAVTAGAMTGIAASKEGGVGGELDDARIQTEINNAWFRNDVEMFSKLHTTVEQGRVLITGVVQAPEDRVEAVRLAWQVKGVTQIINEIQVADSEGVGGYLKDTWIGTQLRAKLTANRDVNALNYSIDVVRGVVYLMGIAESQSELNEVVDIARNINYVQNVVSYVKVKVPQAPLIKDAHVQSAPAAGSSVTTYPVKDNGPASGGGLSKPIVDDPGYGGSQGVIGGGSSGVTKENLP